MRSVNDYTDSLLIMNDVFSPYQNNCNLRNCKLLECANPKTGDCRPDETAFRANPLRKHGSNHINPLTTNVPII